MAGQPGRRNIAGDGWRIQALARLRDGLRVHVRREDLELAIEIQRRDRLAKGDRDRVGFLAGAASGDPRAKRVILGPGAQQVRQTLLAQKFEYPRIAEKAGDVNEEILRELVAFARVVPQQVEIGLAVSGHARPHGHSPFDPAPQRAPLVGREIMPRRLPQDLDDAREPVVPRRGPGRDVRANPRPSVFDDGRRNSGDGEHHVDGARLDRPARHTVEGRFPGVLRDDEAALRLHVLQPLASVRARSGKNDANRVFAKFGGQRMQQKVEGKPRAMPLPRLRKPQRPVAHGQIASRRYDVELALFDRHSVGGLQHRHRGAFAEQLDHHAFVRGIEMHDENAGGLEAGGRRLDEFGARLEPARRGANSDHRKINRRFAGFSRRIDHRGLTRTAASHAGRFLLFSRRRRPNLP